MSDEKDEGQKAPAQPRFLREERVRVCGKWQKKGYKASKEEKAAYERKMRIRNERMEAQKKSAAKGK